MSKIVTTPKGKAVWPRIDTADTKFDEDGVYSCKLHVTEADFKAFEALIQPKLDAAYKEECSRQGKEKIRMAASSPLRINDEGDYEIYAKQKARVHTKSKGTLEFSIAAVDSQGKKIAMPKIGSGSTLKMAVEVNTWFVPSQGFGYTLRLRAVQVLELIEYGGGDSSFGFGAEEDGYVGSGESLNDAFEVADEAETTNAPF
jgi:hypothetical protein